MSLLVLGGDKSFYSALGLLLTPPHWLGKGASHYHPLEVEIQASQIVYDIMSTGLFPLSICPSLTLCQGVGELITAWQGVKYRVSG